MQQDESTAESNRLLTSKWHFALLILRGMLMLSASRSTLPVN
jgi:hypothetical protein